MSEVEFDLILDAVSMAIAPGLDEDLLAELYRYAEPPKAGNDNQGIPRLAPSPAEMYAS
jgi:hypothetical protein